MDKRELRRIIRNRKESLSVVDKLKAAESVFSALENTEIFQHANKILIYHSLPDELSTHSFIDKWCNRKQFFLPRVNGEILDILPYEKSQLETGAFHIEEPSGNDIHQCSEMDLIIVPAMAYDIHGNRLGRGKGFYDRLLHDACATKIGICYDFQLVDEVPSEEHDISMDIVITETQYIVIPKK